MLPETFKDTCLFHVVRLGTGSTVAYNIQSEVGAEGPPVISLLSE
ncbi:uncharacterized protein PpBr36_11406 [Pyricularia pennisetigena]|nr:uncharacterized protein PpBr36_11406 [Pyricularia pennisetigena]TLS20357.1 hypothetical protein PpBr36_11406 [Pyricularia pennisetigena]